MKSIENLTTNDVANYVSLAKKTSCAFLGHTNLQQS